MTDPDPLPRLTFVEAIIPVASLILLVALSYFLFGDAGAGGPNQIALTVATMIAVFIAWRRGYALKTLNEAAVASVNSGIGAIFILGAVGALIGTWALSGTLVAMVYYGLQLLNPNYFYATAVVICAVVSASIGSSWTVVGTIGIGLMGISTNLGLDPAITAAAVISGSYFGDTTSPLSDSANLAAATAGAGLYDHIRETTLTSALALMVALGVFWWFGRPAELGSMDKIAAIESAFHITPILFLPLVVVIVFALFRVQPFTTIFVGALVGGVLAMFLAPERVIAFANVADGIPRSLALLKGVWLALANGYVSTTGYPPLDQLVSRGGMASMLNTVWLIITALAFGGVVERIGVLERLVTPILNAASSAGALVASVVGAVVMTNVVTADQYIAIVLPGRMFKSAFIRRGLAPVVLSRTIGAVGTPTSALVPWNSLRCLHGRHAGRCYDQLRPIRRFQPGQPAACDCDSLHGRADAAQPRRGGRGTISLIRQITRNRSEDMSSEIGTQDRNLSVGGGFSTPPAWVRVLLGVVMVLAGLLILGDVALAALFSPIFIGAVAAIGGIFEIVYALWTRRWRGWGGLVWPIVLGSVYVAVGIVLMSQPLSDLRLTYVIGLLLLLSGIIRVMLGFNHWKDVGWIMLLSGAFGVLAGLIILSGFPKTAFWLFGLLLGIDLIAHGVAWLTYGWLPAARTGQTSATPGRQTGRNRP